MLIGRVPALLTRDWSNTAAMLGCSGIECGADFGASLGAVHNSGQATLSGIYTLFILCKLGRFAEGVWDSLLHDLSSGFAPGLLHDSASMFSMARHHEQPIIRQ